MKKNKEISQEEYDRESVLWMITIYIILALFLTYKGLAWLARKIKNSIV